MRIADARMTLMNQIFSNWKAQDVNDLFRLVRQYADSIKESNRLAGSPDGQEVMLDVLRLS
jgi:hypothetical protein